MPYPLGDSFFIKNYINRACFVFYLLKKFKKRGFLRNPKSSFKKIKHIYANIKFLTKSSLLLSLKKLFK